MKICVLLLFLSFCQWLTVAAETVYPLPLQFCVSVRPRDTHSVKFVLRTPESFHGYVDHCWGRQYTWYDANNRLYATLLRHGWIPRYVLTSAQGEKLGEIQNRVFSHNEFYSKNDVLVARIRKAHLLKAEWEIVSEDTSTVLATVSKLWTLTWLVTIIEPDLLEALDVDLNLVTMGVVHEISQYCYQLTTDGPADDSELMRL